MQRSQPVCMRGHQFMPFDKPHIDLRAVRQRPET